jgi:hypothetical protein
MSAKIKQTSIALLSVVSLLGISSATVAASFTFELSDGQGQGKLEFTSSTLTGIGAETTNFKQLTNAQYYLAANWPMNYITPDDNPSFDFYNGKLSGVHTLYSMIVQQKDWPYSIVSSSGIVGQLYLNGQNWNESFNYSPPKGYYSPYINFPLYTAPLNGSISFQTIEPISSNPVPEASNALGVFLGLAGILGFRSRFKK